jgi:hypothetical protein
MKKIFFPCELNLEKVIMQQEKFDEEDLEKENEDHLMTQSFMQD